MELDKSARDAIAGPRIQLSATTKRPTRCAPWSKEVERHRGNVTLFAGTDCWTRALRRRDARGPGSALVLSDKTDPETLRWPPLDALVVAWPGGTDYRRKIALARALIRDGVRHVEIEHEPEWIRAWAMGGRK